MQILNPGTRRALFKMAFGKSAFSANRVLPNIYEDVNAIS